MMSESLASMTQDLFAVHLKKISTQRELFSQLSRDSLVDRLISLDVSTGECPWSISLVMDEEDLSLRIEYECTDDWFHDRDS
jgi:hypothetical protein